MQVLITIGIFLLKKNVHNNTRTENQTLFLFKSYSCSYCNKHLDNIQKYVLSQMILTRNKGKKSINSNQKLKR